MDGVVVAVTVAEEKMSDETVRMNGEWEGALCCSQS